MTHSRKRVCHNVLYDADFEVFGKTSLADLGVFRGSTGQCQYSRGVAGSSFTSNQPTYSYRADAHIPTHSGVRLYRIRPTGSNERSAQ